MEKPYLSTKELSEHDLFKCECDGIHFRHAGNVLTYRTYTRHDKKLIDGQAEDIDAHSHFVYICIGCAKPWIRVASQFVDGSEHINVSKFDAVNEALKADTKTDPHC